MSFVMMSRSSLNLGHVGSETRSVGQIEETSCLHTRHHIFDPVLMKLGQNMCLGDVWVKFDSRSHGVIRANTLEVTFFKESSCHLIRMFVLMIIDI